MAGCMQAWERGRAPRRAGGREAGRGAGGLEAGREVNGGIAGLTLLDTATSFSLSSCCLAASCARCLSSLPAPG